MAGISAIPSKVRGDHNTTDWTANKVAGIRSYNRVIDGIFHSFWMATVVTRTGDKYVATGLPQTAIIDSKYDRVVWVEAAKPETWISKLKEELAPVWKQ